MARNGAQMIAWIHGREVIKVCVKALPKRRRLGHARAKRSRDHAAERKNERWSFAKMQRNFLRTCRGRAPATPEKRILKLVALVSSYLTDLSKHPYADKI